MEDNEFHWNKKAIETIRISVLKCMGTIYYLLGIANRLVLVKQHDIDFADAEKQTNIFIILLILKWQRSIFFYMAIKYKC